MAKETKVYPTKGTFLMGVPHAVHVVDSRAEADELIATGAFTDNPNDADRDDEAVDLTKPPPQPEAQPPEGPAETGGSSDSSEEK